MNLNANLFEAASRAKFRFESSKGWLTVEDLWDLRLSSNTAGSSLDTIAQGLDRQLKASGDTVSFVNPSTAENSELQIKLELVKHIIGVRIAERNARSSAAARREAKQNLMAILEEKKQGDLRGKSTDELQAMIDALGPDLDA